MQDAIDQLPDHLKSYVKGVLLENGLLREQVRLLRIEKFGPRSEKLSDDQLELLEGELSVTAAEVEQEAHQAEEEKLGPKTQRKKKHPGRAEFPPHLERRVTTIPCPPEDCICAHCHEEKAVIGHERTEELGVIPAHYYVKVTLREKRACPAHPEGGVVCAPCPPRILPKSKLSDEMIVDLLVRKYGDHLPVYRQSMILDRDADIDLDRKTLNSVIMKTGALMEALIPTLKLDLFEGAYIQGDETTVPCQTAAVRGRNHRAFMWEFSRPLGPVVFEFQMGRSRAGPEAFLRGFEGILQTDGYVVYDKLGDGIKYAACMAHVRREFHKAHKLQQKDPRPLEILEMIGRLYKIEDQAREAGANHAQRLALRRDHSRTLIQRLQERIVAIRSDADVLPASQLGKACKYAMGQWERLLLFLDHGHLEIDNNWCENAIRPFAIGRKNWLHLGSEPAGPRVAAIASIFETCRRLEINVRTYLLDILPKLPEWPMRRVAELSPMAWKSGQTG
jgi:transposase